MSELSKRLTGLPLAHRLRLAQSLSEEEARALDGDWPTWAHDGQLAPAGDWQCWVLCAGRSFGKTRAGAEWVAMAARDPAARIALVAASIDEARKVMVEGVSGLIAVAEAEIAEWRPSIGRLTFASGAEATLFSGAHPDKLRGPEHHFAWCDELAKWPRAEASWDNLQMGLRLGAAPRALVTTTPRSCETLERIMADPVSVVTRGPTWANPHLPPAFLTAMRRQYGGTRLAEQELEGRMPVGRPGQLFTREMLEGCRITPSGPLAGERSWQRPGRAPPFLKWSAPYSPLPPAGGAGGGGAVSQSTAVLFDHHIPTPQSPPASGRGGRRFQRIAIGLDPPAGGSTCGILVCAVDGEGVGHVLEDASVSDASPEGWAAAAAGAWRRWRDAAEQAEVVAEVNQGGDMVRAVLRQAEPAMRVRDVRARHGKAVRAEPVAMLFEQRRVRLHGRFEELERELCSIVAGGRFTSPDRADAMVWALTALMVGARGEPRVAML